MSMETATPSEIPATTESQPQPIEIPFRSTLSTPHGEMHLMGINQRTNQVILAGPNGLVETTPEELGAWQMLSRSERFREAEVAEEAGEVAVENTVENDEASSTSSVMRKLGEVVVKGSTETQDMATFPDSDSGDETEETKDRDNAEPEEELISTQGHRGTGPPEEPPEDLHSGGDGEPEDEGDDDGEPPTPLDMDLETRARLAHLRIETVMKAAELGVKDPIDYLIKARSSHEMRQHLQQRGWDMTPPPENETEIPRDPVVIVGEKGDRSRKQVDQITRMIESPAGRIEILQALRRPGELPLGLHHLPLGRRLGMRLQAWRIYLRARSKRPDEKEFTMTDGSKEVRQVIYNDGMLGLGAEHVREILKSLRSLDENIRVDRSKLSRMNVHNVMGDLITPRRDLAQQIDRDIRSLIKLGVLKTHRLGFYEHDPFKRRLKEYRSYQDPKVMAEERNEFVRLRFMGSRNAEQQARFDALLEKHPNWE